VKCDREFLRPPVWRRGWGEGVRRFLTQPVVLALLVLSSALISCGFQLRGVQKLPFASLFISSTNSPVAISLTRVLQGQDGLQLTKDAKSAQASIEILNDARERHILALSGAGKVSEFELRQRVSFRVVGAGGKELIPANEIVITRAFAFNDAQVLAKETEEALLYRDMQDDIVQQIMRRLAAVQL
jgi:LPS-assembly lipoprotein